MVVLFKEFCVVKVIFEEEKVNLLVDGVVVVEGIEVGIMIEILVVVMFVD